MAVSSSLTILMTCWAGLSAFDSSDADALLADPADDRADDADVDVGLEQGGADLPQHLVDVVVGEPALAAQALEDPVETIGQCVEHAVDELIGADASRPCVRRSRRGVDCPFSHG